MRAKLVFLLALVIAFMVALPALGVPPSANKEFVSANCGGEDVFVIVAGNSAWGADADGNPDGTHYVLKEIEFRAYFGDFATEPTDTAPLEVFGKTFGNKTGLGEAVHCTFRQQDVSPEGTVTVFGDAWVVLVR